MRIKSLDGIRAVAVIMVVAGHALYFWLGWAGVDIFFVLSGFLITGILRRDREEEHFWLTFYLKRSTRILPPLLLCFLIEALTSKFPWHQIGLYFIFFLANVGMVLHPDQGGALNVLWSLAVEEHFYILWPFAVRFLNRDKLIALLVSILCVEPLLRAVFTPILHSWLPIFALTPFRLDGLAAGSLLALLLEDETTTATIARYSGPVAIVAASIFLASSYSPEFRQRSNTIWFNSVAFTEVSVGAAAWIGFTVTRKNARISRLLSKPALAYVGLISYGIYLYHELVLESVQRILWRIHFDHMRIVFPITASLIGLISVLSFNYYEKPIVAWGHRKAKQLRTSTQFVSGEPTTVKEYSLSVD